MSLAENETLPQQGGGNYQITRFNALRHGLLSQYAVLPWEDAEEYRSLLDALVAEHSPRGTIEQHVVEELAGVIWRKRRLRLAEAAAHHRALKQTINSYQETAKAALIHVVSPDKDEIASVDDAIRTTQEQTAEELADFETDQAMTENALALLEKPTAIAYPRALAALRDDTRAWWEDQLAWDPDDYEEDQTPYRADAESLRRFLESEILPWYEKRRQELDYRPLIRAQAFGEAIEPDRLMRLARYEVHLDRKLERVLAMLFKLQELRRAANPA